MSHNILIINGPNLNLLGTRQPEVYGSVTLAEIERRCEATADALGLQLSFFQSNSEGALIDAVHEARATTHGLLINAGAYTHTSIALADAVATQLRHEMSKNLSMRKSL